MNARTLRKPLALAIAAALLLPGTAFAQTAKGRANKELELEARIAQLEAQVQALLGAQQQQQAAIAQQQGSIAQTQAQLDAVQVAQADGKPKIQSTPILASGNPDARFSFGGFIKVDAMATSTNAGEIADGSAGRMFYLPSAIPVGGADESRTDLDTHAQFSRFWFASDAEVQGHKARAYLEFDLFGGGMANLGNQASTNTHGVTLRQAYVSWDKWLAGQTWSNFQDVAALPDAVDFVGPTEGTVFVRQTQVRYTNGAWSASLENPQTVVAGYRSTSRTTSDDGNVPDITVRWTGKGSWGHVSVAGIARQLRQDTATTHASGNGYGVSLSGKYNLGQQDDLRYMLVGGNGIGRYVGFALGPDGTLDAASSDIEPTGVLAGFVAWRHVFNPKLRGNLMFSRAELDNDPAWTGLAVTKAAQSIHANLIYSPFPKLDVGAELTWGNRELESGADGDLRRVHATVKYSF
ncbi:DcaP family trimeric outer membrane transporter [Thermomonas sp.]|uniref:DcaP family trimeric outer membrane transporter n=1 Tax=Thermomonas sp. TaxID=1971895 RepID=UPI002F0C8788